MTPASQQGFERALGRVLWGAADPSVFWRVSQGVSPSWTPSFAPKGYQPRSVLWEAGRHSSVWGWPKGIPKDSILLGCAPALPWGCTYASGAGLLPASPLREASFCGLPESWLPPALL